MKLSFNFIVLMTASLIPSLAYAKVNKITVFNQANYAVRVAVNDSPQQGTLIDPGHKAVITTSAKSYMVIACIAGQDRDNHCMCNRKSCFHSPQQVITQGEFSNSCDEAWLTLTCFSSP